MVPLRSVLPCGTYTRLHRVEGATGMECSLSYNSMDPSCGWRSARMRRMSVVFPAPVSPQMAVELPGGKS